LPDERVLRLGPDGRAGVAGPGAGDGELPPKRESRREGFRGGNFFVRATTMFQALGGMMDLGRISLSRVLPWHAGFSDLDVICCTVLGFAHGFRIPETDLQWIVGFKRAQDLMDLVLLKDWIGFFKVLGLWSLVFQDRWTVVFGYLGSSLLLVFQDLG